MSWKSGKSGKGGGWSGSGASRDIPRHRWQDSTAAEGKRKRRRRQRYRWVFTAAIAVGLLGLLIWQLMWPERKTPVVILTVTNYAAPIPINDWAEEDRERIMLLHRENLLVTENPEEWTTNDGRGIGTVPDSIPLKRGRRGTALIIYLSMHGLVDRNHEPCLLPAGANIHSEKTWVRVADVLDRIKSSVPDTQNVLLILDCNRLRTNWQLGMVYNSFVERVREVVDQRGRPGLAVITSAGEGQVSWASADLGGSAFGRFLQLGLSGAASDGGGAVTLHELADYLKRHVSAWAQFNRGEPQTPLLMPEDAKDFRLVGIADSDARLSNGEPPPPAVSPDDIGLLWGSLEKLRKFDIIRFDPIAYRNFEHALLRLEQLACGGKAYESDAVDTFHKLKENLGEALKKAAASNADSRALASRLAITGETAWAKIPRAAHTLPASEYFAACGLAQSQGIRELWAQLIDASDGKSAKAVVDAAKDGKLASELGETQFLEAVRDQDVHALRPNLDLNSVVRLRNTAEELAVPRGKDGMPGDERAHYYARNVAARADAQRRLAEDILFVAEQDAEPERYDDYAAAAESLYEETRDAMDDATAAFRVLDEARAGVPYIADWLCSREAAGFAGDEEDVGVRDSLNPLIQEIRTLSESINRFEHSAESTSLLPFGQYADSLRRKLKELGIKKETDHLVDEAPPGCAGWREIDALLLVPLIPSEKRAELLQKRSEISSELQKHFVSNAKKGESAAAENSGSNRADYLNIMSEWKNHPLLEILQFDDTQVANGQGRLNWCDEVGDKVRNCLQDHALLKDFSKAASLNAPVLRERAELSSTEQALRATAALGHGKSAGPNDPIAELRRFDLQQLLIWHARRALDDFWGDLPTDGDSVPFFAQAAEDFLLAAREVYNEPPSSASDQIEKLNEQLKRLRQAKQAPIAIAANSQLSPDPAEPADISLTVGASSSTMQYPDGIAALYVRNGESRLTDLQFERKEGTEKGFLDLRRPVGNPQQFRLAMHNPANGDPTRAVAFFRGSEIAVPLDLDPLKGVRIDYVPQRYERQSINLRGGVAQRLSIVFILDCSHSMEETTEIVNERNKQVETVSRMTSAKEQLVKMLEELAQRNLDGAGIQVGVRLFGHRVAWEVGEDRRRTGRIVSQENYKRWGPFPPNLTPSNDVELIFPLGRFQPKDASNIKERLSTVSFHGETPLYLALVQSLAEDFRNDDPNTRKSIIVITDGQNKQFAPDTYKRDVIDAWKEHQIPVHILGFEIVPGETKEYLEIAAETDQGIGFSMASSGAELLRELRRQLAADTYTVRNATDSQAEPITKPLNSPVAIDGARLPNQYTVDFRTVAPKEVTLEGGEMIQLYVDQQGSNVDIVARPYDDDVRNRGYLTESGRLTDLLLRVSSRREKSSTVFKASLQRDPRNAYFTPRPAETWLEVTPLAENGTESQPYVFYDRNFIRDEPVPVLEWAADDWPVDARRARIRLWCKYQPTPPTRTMPLNRLLASPETVRGTRLSAKAAADNETFRIQIEERHPATSRVDAYRLQLLTDPQAKPIRVSHHFISDGENRIATHTFYFEGDDEDLVKRPNASVVLLTDANAVRDGSLQLPNEAGMVVPVRESGNVFAPSATASGN